MSSVLKLFAEGNDVLQISTVICARAGVEIQIEPLNSYSLKAARIQRSALDALYIYIYASMHPCICASMQLCIYLSINLSAYTLTQGRVQCGVQRAREPRLIAQLVPREHLCGPRERAALHADNAIHAARQYYDQPSDARPLGNG